MACKDRKNDGRAVRGRGHLDRQAVLDTAGGLWARFVGILIYFALACPFMLLAWIGVSLAANPQRYKAELDPPKVLESLPKLQTGPLTGWYVYVYVDGERVVCANPQVWDGPKVITCGHVVSIDNEVPQSQTPEATGPLAGYVPKYAYPPGEDPYSQMVLDEIDLVQRRLTYEGGNERRRPR